MQEPDELVACMAEVRDRLFTILEDHEREVHGGRACMANRISAVAYLAHCLGVRSIKQGRDLMMGILDYNARCKDADCRHKN
jgi:hypothetical protein